MNQHRSEFPNYLLQLTNQTLLQKLVDFFCDRFHLNNQKKGLSMHERFSHIEAWDCLRSLSDGVEENDFCTGDANGSGGLRRKAFKRCSFKEAYTRWGNQIVEVSCDLLTTFTPMCPKLNQLRSGHRTKPTSSQHYFQTCPTKEHHSTANTIKMSFQMNVCAFKYLSSIKDAFKIALWIWLCISRMWWREQININKFNSDLYLLSALSWSRERGSHQRS